MPTFIMIAWDGPDGVERRKRHRDAHLKHVSALRSEGKIVFAGPIRDDSETHSIGAVIVIETESLGEARAMVDRDPYTTGGVFENIVVKPFRQVIPDPT